VTILLGNRSNFQTELFRYFNITIAKQQSTRDGTHPDGCTDDATRDIRTAIWEYARRKGPVLEKTDCPIWEENLQFPPGIRKSRGVFSARQHRFTCQKQLLCWH